MTIPDFINIFRYDFKTPDFRDVFPQVIKILVYNGLVRSDFKISDFNEDAKKGIKFILLLDLRSDIFVFFEI